MNSGVANCDDEDDDGLPDAAFTEDELAAGVQHIVRTGDPNATSSNRRSSPAHMHETWNAADDEFTDAPEEPTRFETFAQALAWSKANPGRSFARAADGWGFEPKPHRPARSDIDVRHARRCEIKALTPHLHEVLSRSGSGRYGVVMRPFYRGTWNAELDRLTLTQLRRLRLLLSLDLEDNRKYLRQLYAEMRRFPSMRGRDYGQDLFEKLQDVVKSAITDIEKRIARYVP